MPDSINFTNSTSPDILKEETNGELGKWLKIYELRYDYSWKYFEHHANQRMTMFNFFIVFSGLLISGCIQLVLDSHFILLIFTSLFGAVITWHFLLLDRRNQELIYTGEDVLKVLEDEFLFNEFKGKPKKMTHLDDCGERKDDNTVDDRELGIFRRQKSEGDSKNSHKVMMPRIQLLVLCLYGVFMVCGVLCCLFELAFPPSALPAVLLYSLISW